MSSPIKPVRHRDGSCRFTDRSGRQWRIRRLPVRSRGWHAERHGPGGSWFSTKYSARTLRETLRQMREDGMRQA
jgi:hypothetical protein